jgi:solute carrier family 25 S-adenosylmethionine transporter 26
MEALLAGAVAGLSVDLLLFPLDTLKTRLQAKQGFAKSGAFSKLYRGLAPQMAASAPQAAVFFAVYEAAHSLPLENNHLLAAAVAETTACIVRVPAEILKSRMQVDSRKSLPTVAKTLRNTEGIRGFYRGFSMTCFRDVLI